MDWVEDVKKEGCEHATFLLIGNKADLEETRKVSKLEGYEHSRKIGAGFLEASAKSDLNVREAFT